jgi:cbb3-type cytochrome oxidase maturation protein
MIFFSAWILLVALSLWISLAAFFWGLQSGQFSDQERARYLPLRDMTRESEIKIPAGRPVEVYFFVFLGLLVFLGLAASVFLSFFEVNS